MNYLLNKTITNIYTNFESKELILFFNDDSRLILKNCLYYTDLGIINNKITFVSEKGTMGFVIICKELNKNYEDYSYLFLSHNIENYLDKKEISIVYKRVEFVQ